MPIKLDPQEIKTEARSLLRTARVSPLRFTLLYLAVSLALSLIDTAASHVLDSVSVMSFSLSFVSVLVMLINNVLAAGYLNYGLSVHRGLEMPYDSLFDAFPFAEKIVLLLVLQGLAIGVGLTLFIVPGVVLAFSYALALPHLCEEPERGVFDALRRSRAEMRGRKWPLFLLYLSFAPLLLLAATAILFCQEVLSPMCPETLTGDLLYVLAASVLMGAAEFYLRPYLMLARVAFFRRVTQQGGDAADRLEP